MTTSKRDFFTSEIQMELLGTADPCVYTVGPPNKSRPQSSKIERGPSDRFPTCTFFTGKRGGYSFSFSLTKHEKEGEKRVCVGSRKEGKYCMCGSHGKKGKMASALRV